MSMYNLLEQRKLFFSNENNDANNYRINNDKTTTSKSFEYKTKITVKSPDNDAVLNAEVVVPLKYLTNFWRFLNFPLINCQILCNI